MMKRLKTGPSKQKTRSYTSRGGRTKVAPSKLDRYRTVFKLGSGGVGSVHLCEDTFTQEPVAVKVIDLKGRDHVKDSEVKFLRRLKPKVDFHGEGVYNKYVIEFKRHFAIQESKKLSKLYIVQEYCQIGDIFNVMHERGSAFNIEEIRHIVANVLLGLKFIHSRKIVHRDLKCLNILMTRSGRVKLCDFSHSEIVDYNREHGMIESLSTDNWMAPEMFKDGAYYGYEVDVWALGICMLEMLRKEEPFHNDNGNMVMGRIMNLPGSRLETQREQFQIPPPPVELTNTCKSKNNNYWNYYSEEMVYTGLALDEIEVDQEDLKQKHLSIYEDETASFFGGESLMGGGIDSCDDLSAPPKKYSNAFDDNESGCTHTTNTTSEKKKKRNLKATVKKKKKHKSKRRASTDNKKKQERHQLKNQQKKNGGPISIMVKKRRKTKQATNRKKKSIVGELFKRSSLLRRKNVVRPTEEEDQLRKRLGLVNQKRRTKVTKLDFVELEKQADETKFFEFVAWCLCTDQIARPTVHDLLQHPFVRSPVKGLIRSEKTDCSINTHSDFLIQEEMFKEQVIREPEMEEYESDDDCFLSASEKLAERINLANVDFEEENHVCTCSEGQRFLRENICDPVASERYRKSKRVC